MSAVPLFDTVLIANRGEIAVRVIRTLRALGIRSVAVYSDADADAVHTRLADVAVRIGPADARASYLDIDAVLDAARATGAQAIHPGYGFLSENAAFGHACAEAGIVFIGPDEYALAVMGDKIRAKLHVAESGVPVVPGVSDPTLDDAGLIAAAEGVGYPLLIKPSAGGGGKGMQLVRSSDELADGIATARRVAASSFGDDTLLLERFIEEPRHIEVQVLADAHGGVIHLGERECSLQRRHQKVIEEAPSPLLDAATRERIGRAACDAARSVDYRGAGTVEFLVSARDPETFFFIEMNTRLQVEHPVTEAVTGTDIVAEQLHIAAGLPLSLTQGDLRVTGHAIEARVYAESPERGFLPSTGRILAYREPAGVRVDSGIDVDSVVSANYDPMLAKVIAFGADRAEALDRLNAALAETVVLGIDTNIAFLRSLLADDDVRAGRLDTELIDRLPALEPAVPDDALLAVVAETIAAADVEAPGRAAPLWRQRSGWRIGADRPRSLTLEFDTPEGRATRDVPADRGSASALLDQRVTIVRDGASVWVHANGASFQLAVLDRAARLTRSLAAVRRETGGVAPEVRSPMPGTVVAVHVADGDHVEEGAPIASIEAMKMEHRVTAPTVGIVHLDVRVGGLVSRDQLIASVTPITSATSATTSEKEETPS
ncbi:biotin/lipoyl-binding protein [Glaciibacter flavus]|uniref:biotin carboxylase n=1 Tax=Orlajensenia flava TaxID=2565934 RepID=A0A4S4FWX5_9MICO|nr:biotin carboxylase N-terminal domain-containing protein [Glaciibacter flavus]THG35500.1 biotin/lipoyl-binding protein [Glaciibacter flavus]